MDLMGDIGAADQLISARMENKLLKAKVEELKNKVTELTLSNATLLAEVEMYRKDAALPSFSTMALGKASAAEVEQKPLHDFLSSGNGVYPTDAAVSLSNLHGITNPLCCALDRSDSVMATGGADSYLALTAWGAALAPTANASVDTVNKAARIPLSAPVICVSFSNTDNVVAAGCMDGTVHLIGYKLALGRVVATLISGNDIKFTKYVKSLAWSPSKNMLASASADGTVVLTNVKLGNSEDDDEMMDGGENYSTILEPVKSFHLSGAVETLCFVNDGNVLCLYERETSVLTYFDLNDDFAATSHSLNGSVTGGFDSHVSFAVMQLVLSPNGMYLCAATDASRNIIIEVGTSNIVRDLYGHKNDGFSQPRVAWSNSGEYIFGNSQEDSGLCVWDIASTKLLQTGAHKGQHTGKIRDIFGSKMSDTIVTASYDKNVKVWLNEF